MNWPFFTNQEEVWNDSPLFILLTILFAINVSIATWHLVRARIRQNKSHDLFVPVAVMLMLDGGLRVLELVLSQLNTVQWEENQPLGNDSCQIFNQTTTNGSCAFDRKFQQMVCSLSDPDSTNSSRVDEFLGGLQPGQFVSPGGVWVTCAVNPLAFYAHFSSKYFVCLFFSYWMHDLISKTPTESEQHRRMHAVFGIIYFIASFTTVAFTNIGTCFGVRLLFLCNAPWANCHCDWNKAFVAVEALWLMVIAVSFPITAYRLQRILKSKRIRIIERVKQNTWRRVVGVSGLCWVLILLRAMGLILAVSDTSLQFLRFLENQPRLPEEQKNSSTDETIEKFQLEFFIWLTVFECVPSFAVSVFFLPLLRRVQSLRSTVDPGALVQHRRSDYFRDIAFSTLTESLVRMH